LCYQTAEKFDGLGNFDKWISHFEEQFELSSKQEMYNVNSKVGKRRNGELEVTLEISWWVKHSQICSRKGRSKSPFLIA